MCGIVYYHSKSSNNVLKSIIKRYETQKSRGNEGFGLVAFDLPHKEISFYVKEAEEKDMRKQMEEMKNQSQYDCSGVLFHHRHPTSTPNFKECAHPIYVKNAELDDIYFVVHNGVISNAADLKKTHEELGYVYTTQIVKKTSWFTQGAEYQYPEDEQFNDSEALAIELARKIEGKSSSVKAKGSMAFVVLRCSRTGTVKSLHYGRNYRNPLVMEKTEDHFCLKSVGEFKDYVKGDKIFSYDFATEQTTEEDVELDSYTYPNRDWRGQNRQIDLTNKRPEILTTEEPEDKRTRLLLGDGKKLINGLEKQTALQYFAGPSIMDFSIQELQQALNTLEQIQTETLEEFYYVDSLIDLEESCGSYADQNMLKRLKNRKLALDTRLDAIEVMIDPSLLDKPNSIGFRTHKKEKDEGPQA